MLGGDHSIAVGTLTGVAPITQILLAHFVLGEPLSWSLVGGGALILSGIFGSGLREAISRYPGSTSWPGRAGFGWQSISSALIWP